LSLIRIVPAPDMPTGREQLCRCAVRPRPRAERFERRDRTAKLVAGSPTLRVAAEPAAVGELGSRAKERLARAVVPLERGFVQGLEVVTRREGLEMRGARHRPRPAGLAPLPSEALEPDAPLLDAAGREIGLRRVCNVVVEHER